MPRLETLPVRSSPQERVPLLLRPLEKSLLWGEKRPERHAEAVAKEIVVLESVRSSDGEEIKLSEVNLAQQTEEFRKRLQNGESVDGIAKEAFALVREATGRVLGMRQYAEQVMTGVALHGGEIAEMKTGEGKTLSSIMPAYLHALTGEAVHIATANPYLAERDAELLQPVYEALGMSVGVILPPKEEHENATKTSEKQAEDYLIRLAEKQTAYKRDIVYGTTNEFGFDYLRDNMAVISEERVQGEHGFIIVDEADAVLIDEARTPLISEHPVSKEDFEPKWYQEFARLAARMKTGSNSDAIETYDYVVGDRNKYEVEPTEKGQQFIEDQLGIITENGLYSEEHSYLLDYLYTALRAKEFYHRDRDYIVEDGKVQIVDKFTHRVLPGRRYHEGIHQALEAKEGVEILPDSEKFAVISIQNYVKLYNKRAGMSGTAATDAKEFNDMYGMQVVKIPTRLPSRRDDHSPVIYKTEAAKFEGIVDEIWERYQIGQPVLVGTVSIEKSELLAAMLNKRGIPNVVLNASNHAEEAAIIAEAGRRGKVTISTNMAGRGVDIKLGGDAEYLAEDALARKYLPPAIFDSPNLARQKELLKKVRATEYKTMLQDYQQQTAIDAEVVKADGGLFVLGTEYHESRRIDNQLRGRAGRQGDPGETQFYLSFEDTFLQKLTPERAASIKAGFDYKRVPDLSPLRSRRSLEKIFISAQHQMEENGFRDRKEVVDYDTVLDEQRKTFYRERRKLLEGDANELQKQIEDRITDAVTTLVAEKTWGNSMNWDIEGIWEELQQMYPPIGSVSEFAQQVEVKIPHLIRDRDFLRGEITHYLLDAYTARATVVREQYGEANFQYFQRVTLLHYLDLQWKEQMMKMEDLRNAVPLRGYGGRDPKVEFANGGQQLFTQMIQEYNKEVVKNFFAMQIETN